MKISLDNALGLHPEALHLRSARTQVLARNIAHADTPGFKARDVDFQAALADRMQGKHADVRTLRTHSNHIEPSRERLEGEVKYRVPVMPSLDGNTVDVQTEQSRFAENNMQFLASLRFVNGRLNGLMNVIRGE